MALLEDAVVDAGAVLGVEDADTVVLEGVVLELVNVKSQYIRSAI